MTNWQLLIAAGFPTATGLVTIAIALIMSGRLESSLKSRMDKLESKIDRVEASVNARIDRLSDDLRQFYMILGKHDKAIDLLEKNQAS